MEPPIRLILIETLPLFPELVSLSIQWTLSIVPASAAK